MERFLTDVPQSQCVVYLDNLLVHATDFGGALENLHRVFKEIRRAGLRLSPKKCDLLRWEVEFLGHVVREEGVATDPEKVEAVRNWPVSRHVGEVRSFLGLASYYRRFVQEFASIASPLHRLTDKGWEFIWDDDCALAFAQPAPP